MKTGLSDACYGFFSTLANPTRLAILEQLRAADLNVTQLAAALDQEQSMVSHNLTPLERCGLVTSTRRGRTRIYRVNRDTVEPLFATVTTHAARSCPTRGHCARALTRPPRRTK